MDEAPQVELEVVAVCLHLLQSEATEGSQANAFKKSLKKKRENVVI